MFKDLEKPLAQLCNYANGNESEIDQTIINSLNQMHEELNKLIETVQNNFLDQMTSGQNSALINEDLEDKIRYYIRLVGIMLLVLVIVIGIIPLVFFIIIVICRLCHCQKSGRLSNHR